MNTPIKNGILQGDLDTNGFEIIGGDGSGLPVGGTTGQALAKASDTDFDVDWISLSSGGGGAINAPAPLTLNSTGNYTNPGTYPFTAANSGLFIKDATGREILRLYSGNSDTSTVGFNNFNLYLGYEAGYSQPSDNTTAGSYNVGIGPWALRYLTTAQGNTAVGAMALRYVTTGVANVAVGSNALQSNHTLEGSTAVGSNALKDVDTGGQGGDTAIGFAALYQQTLGGDNTAVGRYSGVGTFNDNGMVFVGSGARKDAASGGLSLINAIAIGYQANVVSSYTGVIGNVDFTDVYLGSTAGNATLHAKSVALKILTVATLPGSPTQGQTATVSDGTAALAWGATVTGGGSTKYLVWWNGSAWSVVGK